jgi:hypothetical protein
MTKASLKGLAFVFGVVQIRIRIGTFIRCAGSGWEASMGNRAYLYLQAGHDAQNADGQAQAA